MTRIFISYSHVDRPFVDKLVKELDKRFDVWFDDQLIAGDHWEQEIDNQIALCDVFLYVLTNDAVQSKHCRAEFEVANRFRKIILPVQARGRTQLPDYLVGIQFVDMQYGVEDKQALKKLFRALDPDYDRKLAAETYSKWRIRFWLLLIFLLVTLTSIRQFGKISTTIVSTPTSQPSATPLPGATDTPIPTATTAYTLNLYQPSNREEALRYSGFWEQVTFRDITAPGTVEYDVSVRSDLGLRATFNWCAATAEILDEILVPAEFQFTLDGIVLSDSDFLITHYVQFDDYICQNWDVIIDGWENGRSTTFTIHYSLSEDVYDGYFTFLAGEYHHEIRIHPNLDVPMCDGSVPSQLRAGTNARITPGTNSRLRNAPSLESQVVDSAPAGGLIEIVSGPTCEDNLIWWRVYYDLNPYDDTSNSEEYYYVAEGDSLEYFIEPLVVPSAMDHTVIVPLDSSVTIRPAYQEFERGHMFWIQPLQQIWVLYHSGYWEIFNDKEIPAGWETMDVDYNPPAGLFEPVSGFEIVWELNPQVRDSLGWAVAPEIGLSNTLQYLPYQGAIVLQDDKGNQYNLYANFEWDREIRQE